jgi:hypothetical protein
MSNHFHLVLEPAHQTTLSQFVQWLLTSHVRRYHKHYGTSGHIWQGCFRSFTVQRDECLITVLRYVYRIRFAQVCPAQRENGCGQASAAPRLTDASPVTREGSMQKMHIALKQQK